MKKKALFTVPLIILIGIFIFTNPVSAIDVVDTDFESGTLEGWSRANARNYPRNAPGRLDSPGLAGSNYAMLFDSATRGDYEEVALAVRYSQSLSQTHFFTARIKSNRIGRTIGINMRDVNKNKIVKVNIGGYGGYGNQIQAVIPDPNEDGHALRVNTGLTFTANEEFNLRIKYNYAGGTFEVWKNGDDGNGRTWTATGGARKTMRYIDIDTEHSDWGECWVDNVVVSTNSSSPPPPPPSTFNDVPSGHWAEDAIYDIYDAGITNGCSEDPLLYCPDDPVSKATTPVFLLRAIHGSNYTPPPATGIFADVDVNQWYAPWVEQLYREGITNGCSSNPLMYCPNDDVSKAAMAVLLLRSIHGGNYTPPPATGIFADVDVNQWYAPWVEQLYREGITNGCSSNPLMYCPDRDVNRAAMAVFLDRAFDF